MWYTRPYHRPLALALLVGVAPAWSQSRLQQGNYALPNMLSGARAAEAEAGAQQQ